MTNIHAIVFGDQCATFGMSTSHDSALGRVRVSSLRALSMTDGALTWGQVGSAATAIADTKGDFPGSHAWSPPS